MKRRSCERIHNDGSVKQQSTKNNKQNLGTYRTFERKNRCPSIERMRIVTEKEKIHQGNYDRHQRAIEQRNKQQQNYRINKQVKEIQVGEFRAKSQKRQAFTDRRGQNNTRKQKSRKQLLNSQEKYRFQQVQKIKPKYDVGQVKKTSKDKKQYPAKLKNEQLNQSQRVRIRNLQITVENSEKIKEDGTIPIKLVLVGDGNVGKTSMLISYTTDNFPTDYVPTVFDNYVADIKLGRNKVKLWLWDTAGQQEYEQLRLISYQKADVFFICFSMIDQNSFYNALNKWFREVHQQCPKAIKIFVGTKYDLHQEYLQQEADLTKVIPLDYIQKKCLEKKCNFMPCSGLNQKGLNQVFSKAMSTIIDRVQRKKKQQSSLCQMI